MLLDHPLTTTYSYEIPMVRDNGLKWIGKCLARPNHRILILQPGKVSRLYGQFSLDKTVDLTSEWEILHEWEILLSAAGITITVWPC